MHLAAGISVNRRKNMQAIVVAWALLPGCSLVFVHKHEPKVSTPVASGRTAPERCTTSRLAPVADMTLGVSTLTVGTLYVLGAVVGGSGLSAGGGGLSDSEQQRLNAIGGSLVLTGAILTAVGGWGLKTVHECMRAKDDAAATEFFESHAARRRREAAQLTADAHQAAEANDCGRVTELARRVFQIDRETFHNVFARDPVIATCAPAPPVTTIPRTTGPVAP